MYINKTEYFSSIKTKSKIYIFNIVLIIIHIFQM